MKKNKCSKCNKPLEDNRYGKYRYCLSCHNEWSRLYRKKYSQKSDIQKKKSNCRSYANVYQKRGKLIKKNCLICNSEISEKHHENYDKPLEIIWLCRNCHIKLHMF